VAAVDLRDVTEPSRTSRPTGLGSTTTPGQTSEFQNDAQSRVHSAQLLEGQDANTLSQPARVDCCRLLSKYPGTRARHGHFRPKTRSTSRRRRRCHQPSRQRQLIRLDYDGIARSGLLMTTHPPRRVQLKDLTTHATSPYRATLASTPRGPTHLQRASPPRRESQHRPSAARHQ